MTPDVRVACSWGIREYPVAKGTDVIRPAFTLIHGMI